MNLLPALTIGLTFGSVVGIVVYYIIDYFETDEEVSRNSSKLIFSKQLNRTVYKKNLAVRAQEADLDEPNSLKVDPVVKSSNGIVVVFDGKTKMIDP